MLHMSAARSPSVRWGHRKLCPVAKLDNEAGGNRTHTHDVHVLYQIRPLCRPFIVPSTVRVAFSRNRRYSTLRSDEFFTELSRAGIEPTAARGFHIGITLPQLYHHHGSEEKCGVSGFSPLAQYNHMTEKQLKCLTKVSSRFQPMDKSRRMQLALLVLFDNTGLLIKTACPLFACHYIVWLSKSLLV